MPTLSVSLALSCLVVAGLLDVTLKRYALQPRSRGALIFVIGVVWLCLHCASLIITGATVDLSQSAIVYGTIAALFVTVSNILLIECFAHLPVSLASTIYRLNSVPLVLLAVLFLGEHLSVVEFCGIVAAVISVLVLHTRSASAPTPVIWLALVIAASCIRAAYGFTTKLGLENGADANTMILLAAIGWCIGGPVYALLKERGLRIYGADIAGYGVWCGVLVFGVVWLLTFALQAGDASVVVPISNMGFVAALGIAIALGLERITLRTVCGVAIAVLAIVLLSVGFGGSN